MAASTQLHLRQKQSLALSPQVIRSIRLLQMPVVELQDFINAEVEKNPLLEKSDYAPAPFSSLSSPQDPATDPALLVAARLGLRDYLHEQIIFAFRDNVSHTIALYLSEQIDEAGYFTGSLEETATHFNTALEEIQAIFTHMQAFEPAGIFARDLAECLGLQLRHQGRFFPAMATLLQNLPLLAKHDYAALACLCKVNQDEIRALHDEIRRLTPKPAAGWTGESAAAIVPDAFVTKNADRTFRVTLNTAVLPAIIRNQDYTLDICTSAQEREFFMDCQRHADWLLQALEQRAQTLLKVISAIIQHQQAFLHDGPPALKPLKQTIIAAAIHMHESTVSRVVADKYITTPRGTLPLRCFFSTDTNNHAAKAVEEKIRALIANENPSDILSDEVLQQYLQAEGITIARRTVAKYRERAGIPAASIRKRLKIYEKP